MIRLTIALVSTSLLLSGGNVANVAQTAQSKSPHAGKVYKYQHCNGCETEVTMPQQCDANGRCVPVKDLDCPSDAMCPVQSPPSWWYGERLKVRT